MIRAEVFAQLRFQIVELGAANEILAGYTAVTGRMRAAISDPIPATCILASRSFEPISAKRMASRSPSQS